MYKIMFCGLGGEGIQYTSTILSEIALSKGYFVTLVKSYGPEARGGSSYAYVVISDKLIANPIFKEGYILVSQKEACVERHSEKSEFIIYSEAANHRKSQNMFLLGILCKRLDFDKETCILIIKKETGEKHADLIESNEIAFSEGYDMRKIP